MSKPKLVKLKAIIVLAWIGFRNPAFRKAGWALVPTEPGEYVDKQGDPWTLTDSGRWVDKDNLFGPKWLNWVLAEYAFRRVSR